MIGLTIGVTIARVLWTRLPQKELKEATVRFCGAAKLALDENAGVVASGINSSLSTLPLEIARTTAALGINRWLREEQTKWNRLIPVLISLSAQLPRLTAIRAKVIDSPEAKLYLDSLHQDFSCWMGVFQHCFLRPHSKKTLTSVGALINQLTQKMEDLRIADSLRPFSNDRSSVTLRDVSEYLVAAQLIQQCGDIAATLRLVEYSGDYFL